MSHSFSIARLIICATEVYILKNFGGPRKNRQIWPPGHWPFPTLYFLCNIRHKIFYRFVHVRNNLVQFQIHMRSSLDVWMDDAILRPFHRRRKTGGGGAGGPGPPIISEGGPTYSLSPPPPIIHPPFPSISM